MDYLVDDWVKIRKGKQTNTLLIFKQPFYEIISHAYASKPEFAADPPTHTSNKHQSNIHSTSVPSKFKYKAQ